MLRITAGEKPRVLSFRLEGRLGGPWVEELEQCWRGMVARAGTPALRVDLKGVTFVDARGKAQLTAMHRQGAEFIADDCLTRAIVSEIVEDGIAGAIPRNEDGGGAIVRDGRNP